MSLMHHPLLRIASAGVLGALMAGCVGVPGDPYYDGGYSGGGYYPGSASVTVYEQPGVIYTPPARGLAQLPAAAARLARGRLARTPVARTPRARGA